MQELKGKAAVVTGASRGIGAETARELARCGVSVVLAARTGPAVTDVAAEIDAAGGTAVAVPCDVSRYADLAHAVEVCRTRFGRVDILVNNAGVIDPISRIAGSDPDQWDAVVDINLKGVYHGIRAVLPLMEAQGDGVIVNISSGAAVSALEGWSHYCATKAAVLSLTRCADKEARDKGVRVLGLSPGTVATDMQRKIKASGINPVSTLDWESHVPPDLPARAVAYLCTAAAADLVGQDFKLQSEEGLRRLGFAA